MELDRNNDEIYESVIAVVKAVSELSQSFSPQMSSVDFLKLIEVNSLINLIVFLIKRG